MPDARVVIRFVLGTFRVVRQCPVCNCLIGERKLAEGTYTSNNYRRHFASEHKGGLMATQEKDQASPITAEQKAAARSEASKKAAVTRKANAEASAAEKIAENDSNGVRLGVKPSEAAAAAKKATNDEPRARRASGPRAGSAKSIAVEIINGASEPLSVKEIYEIGQRDDKFAQLQGKNPVNTLAAQVYFAAHDGLVAKVGRGKFGPASGGNSAS